MVRIAGRPRKMSTYKKAGARIAMFRDTSKRERSKPAITANSMANAARTSVFRSPTVISVGKTFTISSRSKNVLIRLLSPFMMIASQPCLLGLELGMLFQQLFRHGDGGVPFLVDLHPGAIVEELVHGAVHRGQKLGAGL